VQAHAQGLTTADTAVFSSMAIAGEGDSSRSVLSAIKAVSPSYPLRGKVKLSDRDDGSAALASSATPAPGTVWVDPAVLANLNLHVGDPLTLGDKRFTIAKVLSFEPDRGSAFINFSPHVMLAMSDLPQTNLIQFGSRVTYRLLLAGVPQTVRAYQTRLEKQIDDDNIKGMRLESLKSGRPEMRATLDRAEQFLSLVGLLSAMLAAIAVAMAARRFMLRHLDACAMLRCLGMTQNQVAVMYLTEFLMVGLLGSGLGALFGFAAHFVLLAWLGNFISGTLPNASWLPALQGVATGMLLLIGFALPPILQLRNVPHNRVIRREQDAPRPLTLASYALGTTVFISLLLWQARDIKLGLLTAAGFIGALAAFALIGWLCLKGLRRLRGISTAAPAGRHHYANRRVRPGPDGVVIADGYPRRSDRRLAAIDAGRCTEPVCGEYSERAKRRGRAGLAPGWRRHA
jgi:putative ABC transport system permease protein